MKELIVMKRTVLKATPAAVWDALTNSEKTKEYFFNCEVHSDWQPGSSITFEGRIFLFKKIKMTGKILEIVPEKLLKYTLQNDDDEDSFSTITDTLTYENGETTLIITDDVGQGEGVEERYKKSVEGWNKVLKGLKELVEEEN